MLTIVKKCVDVWQEREREREKKRAALTPTFPCYFQTPITFNTLSLPPMNALFLLLSNENSKKEIA